MGVTSQQQSQSQAKSKKRVRDDDDDEDDGHAAKAVVKSSQRNNNKEREKEKEKEKERAAENNKRVAFSQPSSSLPSRGDLPGDQDTNALVNDFLRVLLYAHNTQKPVTWAVIRAAVFDGVSPHLTRSFDTIRVIADQRLRAVFGLKLVARDRDKLPAGVVAASQMPNANNNNNNDKDDEEDEDGPSQKVSKDAVYWLENAFDDLTPEETAILVDHNPPSQLARTGLVMTIMCILHLSPAGKIAEKMLLAHLNKLGLQEDPEQLMKEMAQQRYVRKTKEDNDFFVAVDVRGRHEFTAKDVSRFIDTCVFADSNNDRNNNNNRTQTQTQQARRRS